MTREKLLNHFFYFQVALQFLTRIPIELRKPPTEDDISRCGMYFPVVGLVLGSILFFAFKLLILTELPSSLIATLVLALSLLLTGGFHIDGLADSLDGFGGAFDVNRKLEIMRDSRIGTYGTLGITVFCLYRYSAYQSTPSTHAFTFLVIPLVWARLSSLFLIRFLPYANPITSEATVKKIRSKPVVDNLKKSDLLLATCFCLSLSWFLLGAFACLTIFVAFLAMNYACKYYSDKQIKGITGDVLGAANLLIESGTFFLLLIVA